DSVLEAVELDPKQPRQVLRAGFLQLGEGEVHGGDPTLRRMAKAQGEKSIVDNRRARHDYHLLDRVESGLVLTGPEEKALGKGKEQRDKRRDVAERDAKRQIERELKSVRR